ncbi:MAG: hypothetical protein IJM30_05040 [Thermoguttaceae bacterium]|nr:hypothetical protein [Thermoguttaceae bacterium]
MKVTYNGVTLHRVMTTSWDEQTEYDSSGMNMIGNRITFAFEGSIFFDPDIEYVNSRENINADFYQAGANSFSLSFKQRLNLALRNLSMPGAALVVCDDVLNAPIFEAYPVDATVALTDAQRRNVDINAGPKPRNVRVVQVCNLYARISFQVEVTKIRCLGGDTAGLTDLGADPTGSFVVSNRCWTEETMDSHFYTTRVFTGKLRISSAMKSVHYYRHLFYPPLEEGFRRESVRFSESENGLELSYAVTDKQIRCSAPYPATDFSGNVSYSVINGVDMRLNMSLTMIGRPDAPKTALVSRAMQAVVKKIEEFTKNGAQGYQEKMNVSENLGDPPSVTVDVAYRLYGTVKGQIGGNEANSQLSQLYVSNIQLIGEPLEFEDISDGNNVYIYQRQKSAVPNPYGYEVFSYFDPSGQSNREENKGSYGFIKSLATVPCAIQAPIVSQYLNGGSTEITGMLATKAYKDKDGVTYSEESTGAVQEAIDYPYSFYKSDITYYTDYARIALPKAAYCQGGVARYVVQGTVDYGGISLDVYDSSGAKVGVVSGSRDGTVVVADIYVGNSSGSFCGSLPSDAAGDVLGTMTATSLTASITGTPVAPSGSGSGSGETITPNLGSLAGTVSGIDSSGYAGAGSNTRVIALSRPIPKALVVVEAERYGRMPEFPDPDEVVTSSGDDPIAFTCVNVETKICEPKAARNNDDVSYSAVARYEYAMSRQYRKGDEVWLLHNPTFGAESYYPKVLDASGSKIADTTALAVMYDGGQLNHDTGNISHNTQMINP